MKTDCLNIYIDELNKQYKTGIAREHSYRPALKDRKGMTLSFEDVKHYQQIIYVLLQTERIMQEIDN